MRKCDNCGATSTTHQKSTGRPIWRKHTNGILCHKCFAKVYYTKNRPHINRLKREHYSAHRDTILRRNLAWKNANPNYRTAYYLAHKHLENQNSRLHRSLNPDYHKERLSKYRKANPRRIAAYRALRRRALDLATPGWVDWSALLDFFLKRPPGCAVDHIIPLRNSRVCGLNVPWNLQYLTISINSKKHNKFDGTWENLGWMS